MKSAQSMTVCPTSYHKLNFPADSNPSGSRHPLDTPPPRYVSVVALNEIEKDKSSAAATKCREEVTRAARFFTIQCTKMGKNIPNDHKITKITKRP
jgi:hypothetical protein